MTSGNVVLVVGSGGRRYREYLLAGAARRHRLWLLDAAEPTWQRRYLAGWTVVPLVDEARLVPDQEALLKAAHAVEGVAGVISYDETLIVSAAHIASALGLPGLTLDGVQHCRNKHRTRQALTAAGLPQPRFALARTANEAVAAAARIGFPVVLKPRGMGASIGVIRAAGPEELEDAFDVALAASFGGNPSYAGGVLVEELLVGSEVSVDGVVVDGAYRPVFVARKTISPPPYFEEVGHVVDPDDPLLADRAVVDLLRRVHRALGVRDGITHTEIMLTETAPVVVEVNGRLGGDLIPYLGMLATGIDPGAVAADVAAGHPPLLRADRGQTVGIRFAYPPRDCRVREVSLPEPDSLPGLLESAPLAEAGAELRLPPKGYIARYGYVICTGADPRECAARLDAAILKATLSYDEPGQDPAGLIG